MTLNDAAIVSAGEALVDLNPNPMPGGAPMNVAVAAARLGARAAFAGCISTDQHGQALWEYLTESNVELALVKRSLSPTARAIVEHVPKLHYRFEGTGTADLELNELPLTALGDGSHILHGGGLGMFRGRTAETLATAAESCQGIVSLDPNVRPQLVDDRDAWDAYHSRWLSNVGIYKAADEDLDWIWPNRAPEACAEELLAGTAKVVIVTRGSSGLSIYSAAGEATASAVPIEVVDTVGAGDTVCAVVLASLVNWGVTTLDGLEGISVSNWTSVAERASAGAAITCARAGADTPWRKELSEVWPD